MEPLSGIVWGLIDAAVVGVVGLCIKSVKNHSKQIRYMRQGIMWIQHDRLLYICKTHLIAKEITADELENLEGLYKSYHELGGNGTIKKLFERVQNLPIKDDINEE